MESLCRRMMMPHAKATRETRGKHCRTGREQRGFGINKLRKHFPLAAPSPVLRKRFFLSSFWGTERNEGDLFFPQGAQAGAVIIYLIGYEFFVLFPRNGLANNRAASNWLPGNGAIEQPCGRLLIKRDSHE